MSKHDHENCKHLNVKFCPNCQIPYCPDCGKEWQEQWYYTSPYPSYWYGTPQYYTSPYPSYWYGTPQYYTTTSSIGTQSMSLACTHSE